MSFLDNLESNLKSLESQEEGKEAAEQQRRNRERDLASARAAGPHAEELKKGPYTQELLKQTTRVGHAMRTKVHVAWLGPNLRLEARERRLELRPTADGIVALYFDENQREVRAEPLDLNSSPETLLRDWLSA